MGKEEKTLNKNNNDVKPLIKKNIEINNKVEIDKNSSNCVLSCENLVKEFLVGEKVQRVIKGITTSFYEGQFVSIMGPSGCGKSTFLYLLSGIEQITSGKVMLLGKDINKYSEKEMARLRANKISFVFQNYNLIPTFTVYENIITPIMLGKQKVEEYEIDLMLANMGLTKYKNSLVTNLSGGEQQRVAIARALITNPIILFADEPTGNLDSKNSKEVMELFRKINKFTKTTIIQVTHSEEMALFGDRIIRILDGCVLSDEKVSHEKNEHN